MKVIIPEESDVSLRTVLQPSKRTKVVLTHGAEQRPKGRTDRNYVHWIHNRHKMEGGAIPYHFILTSAGEIINTRHVNTTISSRYLPSHEHDIIIYIETDFRLSPVKGLDELATVIANSVVSDEISYESITFVRPGEMGEDRSYATTVFLEDLKARVRRILEEFDTSYICLHDISESGDVVPLQPREKLEVTEVADIAGVDPSVLIDDEDNKLRMNLSLFGDVTLSTLMDQWWFIPNSQRTFIVGSSVDAIKKGKASAADIANLVNMIDGNKIYGPDISAGDILVNGSDRMSVGQDNKYIPNTHAPINQPGKKRNETPAITSETVNPEDIGRKPYHPDKLRNLSLPGYENAFLEFSNIKTGETQSIGFMVSPNSVSHSMTSMRSLNRTMGGWFVMRNGQQPERIDLTGYMVDSADVQERHNFIEEYYKKYVVDKKNANNETYNDWATSLVIEGRRYIGYIDSFSPSKASAASPFLYNYSLSFISLEDHLVYRSANSKARKYSKYVDASFTQQEQRKFVGPTWASMLKV